MISFISRTKSLSFKTPNCGKLVAFIKWIVSPSSSENRSIKSSLEKNIVSSSRIDFENEKVKILREHDYKSSYSLEYLIKMVKAKSLSEDVTLSFSDDYPLTLKYGNGVDVELVFILAPRMN